MKHPGNSENSKLNGEWAKHVRSVWKKLTAKKRRAAGKKIIKMVYWG
jgi:hypothetical protein